MPFIGKDWRSPGEAWVKTETLGWQRMKIIESQLHPGCHQSSACSWPPRSEFGQHMQRNNCRNEDDKQNIVGTNNFNDSLSTTSESNSSDGSQSSSPTSSPEKTPNQPYYQHHHLHPITISSPYGKYSCCAHHIESARSSPNYYSSNTNSSHPPEAQLMSRSLSKESVTTPDKNVRSQPRMRYNNSVSDFRISSSAADQFYNNIDNNNLETSSPSHDWDKMEDKDIQSGATRPILMKNGLKIDDTEIPGSLTRSSDSINAAQDSKIRHNFGNTNNNCCCCNNYNYVGQSSPCNNVKEQYVKKAPHCRVSVRTKEVVMYNTISEACYSLDFCNAIHDIRRFNYICKLLHLLITQNLTSLSGCATKVLFTMLEQVAWEVSNNKRNIHILKNLLNELKIMIQKNYCWGRPIGSSLLWQQHFDTIERISQIVNGIELSPPKSETKQTTFNDLPVEMVREILLRLNDYRDLINSAQASPVMRTMIDSQHIWHKLCKYHFTEQQLKLAIEHNNLFTKRGNVCGLKYARTVSADGKTSFRNPVMHKLKYNSTRHQLEQTKNRRSGRLKEAVVTPDKPKSSYVTRAIKIFDNQESSTTLGSCQVGKAEQDVAKGVRKLESDGKRLNDLQRMVNKENAQSNTNHPSQEIDWERIFHQLRKKFDLKEEYADCLLLCRHCRCLFWKSFGHPCIKNDEFPSLESQQDGCLYPVMSNGDDFLPSSSRQQNVQQNEQQHSRPSVAILSRNFDNRAQGFSQNVVSENVLNNQIGRPQQPLNNSGNPLRERNQAQLRNRNNNSNSNEQTRQKVLVPKHVAISPQAFLKFFSL